MKNKINSILSILMLVSLLLTACAGAAVTEAPAQPEVEVQEPTQAPTAEPTAVPTVEEPTVEPEEMTLLDLDAAFGAVLGNMAAYNTINAETLLTEMVESSPFLLDVRTLAEVEEQGHIEGAVHIQLDELAQNLNLLPTFDTPIVTYCGSGWRATIAMTALSALGWTDVRALKATFADWKDAGNPVADGVPAAEVLGAAAPDPGMVAAVAEMLNVYGVKPYGVVSADDLNLAIAENPDLIVIDVRTAKEVEEKGIIDAPNFVHIPLEELVAQKAAWPAVDASIAIYCGSGHRSTMAMTILGAYGYQDILSLKGGFGGWVGAGFATVGGMVPEPDFATPLADMLANMTAYNTIKADGLMAEMVEDQPPYILDVRTTAEVEEKGHIEGAFNIPLEELALHVDLLPDFDTPIVTYCGSGWRATIAMTVLHAMGWTDVRALKTTFADWVAAGNPVVAGLPEPMPLNVVTVDAGVLDSVNEMLAVYGVKPYAGISADDFNIALGENPDLIVIDVRTVSELEENGIIDVGDVAFIHIALEDFIANMDLWPAEKDARIVVYCGSGHRSTMAASMLGLYGYTDVWSLQGGFGGWETAAYPVVEYAAP